ncbi:MAG TPA: UDP-glucose 4-epimerase GalE [Cyclobacteriaceae bacterium]|nr:UDP-glucose 4-epimerase GalE [Cyclobacteriaceae bacterium]
MKKILVTGGAGYIGSHTVVELIQSGYDPVVIDSLVNSDRSLIAGIEKITSKKVNFHKGDCCDKDFVANVFKTQGPIDAVIHFAAFKSVGESGSKPLEYHQNNVGSLLVLLEVMKDFGVRDIIFSSSCTVYGQPDQIPVNEMAPFKRAESPYGATKQICERILEDVSMVGYRVISLRYFNPIGAHPSSHIGEISIGTPNNLIPYVTQTAAGIRERLTVFGDDYDTPDGSCIRDYIHVVDVAIAHVKAFDYLSKQPFKTLFDAFNLGTGVGVSVLEVIEKFKKVTGVNPPYSIGPRRSGDVVKVYADPKKAARVLGWKTKFSIEEGLLHAWLWQKQLSK